MRPPLRPLSVVLALALTGCATTVPYTGQGPHPQLERGAPCWPVDALGNVLSLPMKLLLWQWRFNSHTISPQTEEVVVRYLAARPLTPLQDTKFRLNQYRPLKDLARAAGNHYVALPYRIILGVPLTLIMDVLLPGRLFPWGDYYNPYTNTVHLYSDHPAIALHEAGHAHDFALRRYKGTYALVRLLPGVDLYQEYVASKEAITYLKQVHDTPGEAEAYKALYPAYGTYVGAYFFPPIGTLVGVLVGHLIGRSDAAAVKARPPVVPPPAPAAAEASGTPALSAVDAPAPAAAP